MQICSDCGVIQTHHRGHQIITKDQLIGTNRQQLMTQLTKMRQKFNKITSKKQRCSMDMQIYRTQLKWSKQRIKKYCQQILHKIDQEGEKQIEQFIQKIGEYQKILQDIKNKQKQIQKLLSVHNSTGIEKMTDTKQRLGDMKMGKPSSISRIKSYSQINQQQQEQAQNLFFPNPKKLIILDEIFPTFANFTYQFDYHNLKQDNFHYSNYFELWGQDWRLKIYPSGNTGAINKFLSVFLQLANGHTVQKAKKYVYKIQLLSLNKAGSTIVKQYCSIFESGESWGYSDYLNLSHLHEYLHDGKLLFSISIRNQTYEGLCNDLKKYITKIQSQNKILQKLLCQSSRENHSNSQSFYNSRVKQSDYSQLYSQSRSQSQIKGQIALNQDIQINGSLEREEISIDASITSIISA